MTLKERLKYMEFVYLDCDRIWAAASEEIALKYEDALDDMEYAYVLMSSIQEGIHIDTIENETLEAWQLFVKGNTEFFEIYLQEMEKKYVFVLEPISKEPETLDIVLPTVAKEELAHGI